MSLTVHFCVPYCPLLCPILSTFVSLTVHFCVPYPPETLTLPRARDPPNRYLTVLLTVLLTVYLIKRVRARDKKSSNFWGFGLLRNYISLKPQRQVQEQDLKGRLAAQACIKKTKVKIKPFFKEKTDWMTCSKLVVLNRQFSAYRKLVRGSLSLGQG